MVLSNKESALLYIYKGDHDMAERELKKWKGDIGFIEAGYYLAQLKYENVNLFLNFLSNPTKELMGKLDVRRTENFVEMINCLIDIACHCAREGYQYSGEFYRYEDARNLNSYKSGVVPSFKSASFDRGGVEIFNKPGKKLLEICPDGFCPYIPIDKLIQNQLSDEHELLFPPFLDCYVDNGQLRFYVDENKKVPDVNWPDLREACYHFAEQYNEDKKRGIISKKLKKYCKILYNDLRKKALSCYKSCMYEIAEQREYN